MFATSREEALWKRGYICALIDLEQIDLAEWNTLINRVNSEIATEDKKEGK